MRNGLALVGRGRLVEILGVRCFLASLGFDRQAPPPCKEEEKAAGKSEGGANHGVRIR